MVTRRKLLKAMGVAGAGALAPSGLLRAGAAWADGPTLEEGLSFDEAHSPFTLGVASGYPTANSVILWTRLACDPLTADGGQGQDPVDVRWVIGTDKGVVEATLAAGGGTTVTAVEASGHSVHVEATGLSPSTTYWYGFAAKNQSQVDVVSWIGRTRTAPVGPTSQVRFAMASCQQLGAGWYPAYRHIANEDLDFVLHLGDYIYGDTGGDGRVRSHGDGFATTEEQFRIKHARYKGDPDLRLAHAMHPWILTWDDHEVQNNYAGANGVYHERMTNGYKAYYEHLPIRLTAAGPPSGHSFRIYQQVQYGDLLDVALLDTRQHREPPAILAQTMLGAQQKAWLKNLLSTNTATWRVLATPTPLTRENNHQDGWDGYTEERTELLQFIRTQGQGRTVALTGDSHYTYWQHVRENPLNPFSPIVLPEFGGAAITSDNPGDTQARRDRVYLTHPFVRYLEAREHGYMVCDVTPERWRTSMRVLQNTLNPAERGRLDPDATVAESIVFDVFPGAPQMHHVSGGGANTNPG